MAFEDTWEAAIQDPRYKKKSPQEKMQYARWFAKNIAREEVSASDPRMKSFFDNAVRVAPRPLPRVKPPTSLDIGTAAAKATFEGAKEGFQAGFIPSIIGAASGKFVSDLPSIFDYGEISQIDVSPSNIANVLDPRTEAGQYFLGAVGGQLPGILAGGAIGSAAMKAASKAFAKATPKEKLAAQLIASSGASVAPGAAVTAGSLALAPESRQKAIVEKAMVGLPVMAGAGILGPLIGAAAAKRAAARPVVEPPPPPPPVEPIQGRPIPPGFERPTTTSRPVPAIEGPAIPIGRGPIITPPPRTPLQLGMPEGPEVIPDFGRQAMATPRAVGQFSDEALMGRALYRETPQLPAPGAIQVGPPMVRPAGTGVEYPVGLPPVFEPQAGVRPPGMPTPAVGLPPTIIPEMIPPSRQLPAPSGQQIRPATMAGEEGFVAQTPPRGYMETMYGRSVSQQDVVSIQARRQAAEDAYTKLISSTVPTAPKAAAQYRAAVDDALNTLNQLRSQELEMIQRASQMYPETTQPLGLGVSERVQIPGVPPQSSAGRGMMSPGFTRDIPGLALPQRPPVLPPSTFEEVVIPTPKKKDLSKQPSQPGLLQRLIQEEEGTYRPGAAFDAAKNAYGVFKQAARTYGPGLAEKVTSGIQRIGDLEYAIVDNILGKYSGLTSRRISEMTVGAIDDLLTTRGITNAPNTLRRYLTSAIQQTPGRNYTEKTRNLYQILKTTPFNSGIKAVDSLINFPRQLFVTNYGLSPEVIAAKTAAREASLAQTARLDQWLDRVTKTRQDVDQVQLYRDIEDSQYAGNDPDVLEAKGIIKDIQTNLQKLGAITQEQFDIFNSTYMPRDYMKYWLDPDSSNVLAYLFKAVNKTGLNGWYARGTTQRMSLEQAQKDIANGSAWKIIGDPDANNMVTVRRDLSKDERRAAGEIEHAARQLLRYSVQSKDTLEKAFYLDGLSKGSDSLGKWAIKESDVFQPKPGTSATRPDTYVDPATGQTYVYLSGEKDKGINTLGNLANHYVREDIASMALSNKWVLDSMPFSAVGKLEIGAEAFKKAFGNDIWKSLVTIGNFPTYLFNNVMVNPTSLVLSGGSISDIPKAMYKIFANDVDIQKLESIGLIKNGRLLQEITARLTPVITQVANTTKNPRVMTADVFARAYDAMLAMRADPKQAGVILNSALKNTPYVATLGKDAASRLAAKVRKAAGGADDIYRVALVVGLMRRQNMSLEQAAKVAEKTFYNAKNFDSPGIRIAEAYNPLMKVSAYTLDHYPAEIISNPHRALYLATIGTSLPFAAAAMMPSKGESISERINTYMSEQKLLPKRMRQGVSLGVPASFPIPSDSEGKPRYLDLSASSALGAFTGVEGLGGLPRLLAPGGFQSTIAQLIFNKDWFTNRELKKVGKADEEVLADYRGEFIKRSVTPGAIAGISEIAKTSDIFPEGTPLVGGPAARGPEYTVGTQVLRAGGLKVTPINIQKSAEMTMMQYQTELREQQTMLRSALRKMQSAGEAGSESGVEKYRREADAIIEQIRRTQERAAKLSADLQPALNRASQVGQDTAERAGDVITEPGYGVPVR